eukprot:65925_1
MLHITSTNTGLLTQISTTTSKFLRNSSDNLNTQFSMDNINKMVIFNKKHSINPVSENNVHSIKKYNEERISLKEFVIKAHQYMENNQLSLRQYKRCIVSILWQLA